MIASLLLAPIAALADEPPGVPDDNRLEQSRELVKQFGSTLQKELMGAMSAGGPPNAVRICRDRAPAIAAELARHSGAKIGRTSLKTRNPQNAPEPWQRSVLLQFDEVGASAGDERLEFAAHNPEPGVEFRYMQAIVTKPMCLACHGEPAEPIRNVLDDAYPHDAATGYETGDIRGAFHIVWPEEGQDNDR
jgi:hypothetical protein